MITGLDVTFVTIPFTRPELWAWGERMGVTSAVIELHTDAGIDGIGEALVVLGPTPPIVLEILRRMEELVIGEAPNRVEFLTAKILGQGAWHFFRETAFTCWAGIEMACWDIVGKSTGLSVCELLGGPIRTDVPAMFYVYGSREISEMVEYAQEGVARGFGTVYVKVGIEEERDIELVARIREAIGPKPKLRVDANEAWSPGTAVRVLGRMRPYVIEYAEQPTLMFDLDGLAHVRRASGVPVAATQSSWGEFRIIDLIKRNACDVLMTDPHQEGGILAFKKAACIAHAAGLPMVNHAFSPATITMHAQLSVMGSTPGFILANQGHQDLLSGDVVTRPLDYANGRMKIPTGPGLGLELDRARLEEYHDLFEREGFASAHAGQTTDQMITVPNQ
jgi:L-alanine-DL-glutamate epimerase and related enzymes of enolase superfamily